MNSLAYARMLCCVLVLPMLSGTYADSDNTTASSEATRFSFFHTFANADNETALSTLEGQQRALLESFNDIIVVTTPDPLEQQLSLTKNDTTSTSSGSVAPLAGLLKNYTLAGDNRVAFKTNQWQVTRDSALNGSVWTRLQALENTEPNDSLTPDVCVVVVTVPSTDASQLVKVASRVNTFCAPEDVVLLGFTSAFTDELAQYLEGDEAINAQYVPRIMKEAVAFAQQTGNPQLGTVPAVNRLFIATPDTSCLEHAVAATVNDAAATDMSVELCFGLACTTCASLADPTSSNDTGSQGSSSGAAAQSELHASSSKSGLVVFFSCGSFILGCALVFCIFFRKQFFMPSEATKPEKDLTANLAYVLRM